MNTGHNIVIVGGGAGGLELASKLGDTLGKRGRANITLLDCNKTHIWKPLLHEIAAGSMNPDRHALDYMAQAHWHSFHFRLGAMDGINRQKKEIYVAAECDEEGLEIIARRTIAYDTLVMAVGSTTHDFGVSGAREYAIAMDTQEQAKRFHRRLYNALLRAQNGPVQAGQLEVVIVGAGATGVELAAELHKTTRDLAAYGLDKIDADRDIKISLIEAGTRILPALPPRLSMAADMELRKLRVHIYTGERVTAVLDNGVQTAKGRFIPSALVVWAAGIKAPDFLAKLDGLEVNSINQLMVRPSLQATVDDSIFALGDCAACPWEGHRDNVPPRAQAAHQQASFLLKALNKRLQGQTNLPKFRYRDYGSLVNLGHYSTVGNLMGALSGGSLFVEGLIARFMYQSLYQLHLMALHGTWSVLLHVLARFISRRTEPRVKLH